MTISEGTGPISSSCDEEEEDEEVDSLEDEDSSEDVDSSEEELSEEESAGTRLDDFGFTLTLQAAKALTAAMERSNKNCFFIV